MFGHAWLGNGCWVLANGLFGLNSAIGFTFENNDSVLPGTSWLHCDFACSKIVDALACSLQPIPNSHYPMAQSLLVPVGRDLHADGINSREKKTDDESTEIDETHRGQINEREKVGRRCNQAADKKKVLMVKSGLQHPALQKSKYLQ